MRKFSATGHLGRAGGLLSAFTYTLQIVSGKRGSHSPVFLRVDELSTSKLPGPLIKMHISSLTPGPLIQKLCQRGNLLY